ncbi:hypothetical protein BJ980_003696 [Nocardioides daedukensis]|uniref:Uncharacterized protein n=1 Tax=Nocardioides daedukensis TaxID=634462 RepID=A0A7Y9S672_9ACTN|nr:DUF6629 family protein [Nocardioides daedukensis]NYG60773.1 hypothetical protein [Nocardioides daedukensis]
MCFSPEMDAAAGLVVTGIGIDCLRHVTSRNQLALASLPLVFGVHQLIETFVWLELQGRASQCTGDVATYAYLAIAAVLVPVLVPFAFLRIGVGRSRWLDRGFVAAGVIAAVLLAELMAEDTPDRRIDGHQITYFAGQYIPDYVLPIYAFACLGPALLARSRPLQLFGVLNLVVVAVLAALNQGGVVSLWCLWAACTSILIDLHLRGVRLGLREVIDEPESDQRSPVGGSRP